MDPTTTQIIGTVLFACAVLHTFMVKQFEHLAHKYPEGSVGENIFHFLAEVEAVFGIWSAIFILYLTFTMGLAVHDENHVLTGGAIKFLEGLNFTEPAFVFIIMSMAATRPLILFAEKIIFGVSKILPLPGKMAFYVSVLVVGPLLGSFITEPAAMTLSALILLNYFYKDKNTSSAFKYATIGCLFVNVSVGGTLTHFAAPPVLMVASKWQWGMGFMLTHFGIKAMTAIILSTLLYAFYFKKELIGDFKIEKKNDGKLDPVWWVTLLHLLFLALVVYTAHHMVFFFGLFLFFLGFVVVTQEYQSELRLKEGLLVGFFLGGLVVLGSQQDWWLKEIITKLDNLVLYAGATGLTAITDNAALTYLGSLVPLTPEQQYYLVAGAVTGGGLTVIANAPNPAGFGILKSSFGDEGISPIGLFLGALIPTLICILCFNFIPSLSF